MLAGGRESFGGTRESRRPGDAESAEQSGDVAASEGFEATSHDSDQVRPGLRKYCRYPVDRRSDKSYLLVCHPQRTTSPAVTHFKTLCVMIHTGRVSALLHVVRAEQTPVVVRPGFCFWLTPKRRRCRSVTLIPPAQASLRHGSKDVPREESQSWNDVSGSYASEVLGSDVVEE